MEIDAMSLADNLRFCTVCKTYDRYDRLVKFSRRASGHPACLLKRDGVAVLARVAQGQLHRFPPGLLRQYRGAVAAWRRSKRADWRRW